MVTRAFRWHTVNLNIHVSPTVRDYLGLRGIDQVEWKFCSVGQVFSVGPWAVRGDNNALVFHLFYRLAL